MSGKRLTLPKKTFCFIFAINAIFISLNLGSLLGVKLDFFGIAIYILFLRYVLKNYRDLLVKYMYLFIISSYHICSVFIVENYKIFMYNLQKYSYYTGAFLPLLYSYILGFSVLIILECNKSSKIINSIRLEKENDNNRLLIKVPTKKKIRALTLVAYLILFYMLFRLRGSGYYSMGGIDRFAYRNRVFSEIDSKLYTYIVWLLPIPLLGNNFDMEKTAFTFFAFYIFYLIWVGDKFGSLFSALYFYILISWATKNLNKDTFKRLMYLMIAAMLLLGLYIGYQVFYERGNLSEIKVYFMNRLTGGQSDLWWAVYSKEKDLGWNLSEFKDELKSIFMQPNSPLEISDCDFGIYKMMRFAAPVELVNNYLSRGVRFAASTQASLFYYFKYTGLYIGTILIFILFYILINRAILSYMRCHLIESVCYTMLISKAIYLSNMSGFDMFGNITTISGIIVLIAAKYVRVSYFKAKPEKNLKIMNKNMGERT